MECSIPFTSKELKIASDIFKQAYPNGPQIKSTHHSGSNFVSDFNLTIYEPENKNSSPCFFVSQCQ